jgi:uncharacterized protein
MNQVVRYDYGEVRGVERTPEGFLRVPAAITRVGVLRYKDVNGREWGELKLPEEMFSQESMATLRGRPVCDLHPPGMVTSENWKQYSVGSVGDDARADNDFLVATLTVLDAEEIRLIDAKERVEVSAGYFCEVEPTPGEWNGQKYDGIQRNIRFNHAALGPLGWGRAGSQVALRLDGAAEQVLDDQENRMEHKIKVAGKEYRCDLAGDVAAAQVAVDEQAVQAEKSADLSAVIAGLQKQVTSLLTELAVAKAQVDAAKALEAKEPEEAEEMSPEVMDAKLAARESLRADARKVLGADAKLDGLKTREIHEAVIKHVSPELKLDGSFTDDVVAGMFRGIVSVSSQIAPRNDALAATNEAAARPSPKPSDLKLDGWVPDPVAAMNERTHNAWKKPLLHSKVSGL